MPHDWVMSISLPSGPDPETVVNYILETYPETDVVEAMNAWFFSLDPGKHWPNYATIVTTDEHDDASDLSRPGVYRLNLGVDRATFQRVADADPVHDYTAFDRLLPHPRLCQAALNLDRQPEPPDVQRGRQAAAGPRPRPARRGSIAPRLGGQDVDLVWGEGLIARHDDRLEAHGLGNEHPIEGVTVMKWQPRSSVGVSEGYRQSLESGCLDRADQVVGSTELAQPALDADLPDRRRGHEDVGRGIRDRVARRRGQPGVVGEPPEEGIRVEQQDHRSNDSMIS
jgi:hypothetical protein